MATERRGRSDAAEERAERPMERALSPQGRRTLAGFKRKYGEEDGESRFYTAIKSGTLSSAMWNGNRKPTDPAERSNAGLRGPFTRGRGSETESAPPGLRTFSREARPVPTGPGLRAQAKDGSKHAAVTGEREPGFGGPSGSSSTVGSGKPLAAAYGKKAASERDTAGFGIWSRE